MYQYTVEKDLTALADDEIRDQDLRTETISMINNDRKLKFIYDVQFVTSRLLKESLLKYPVPYDLNKKLIEILHHGGTK